MSACISKTGEFGSHAFEAGICTDCGAIAPHALPNPPACECHDAVTSIREDLDKLTNLLKAIHADLAPTLDALQTSPLLKMFFPKGK